MAHPQGPAAPVRDAPRPRTPHRSAQVGDLPPEGICGLGLVDLLAESSRAGLLRPDGTFAGGVRTIPAVPTRGIELSRGGRQPPRSCQGGHASGQRILMRRLGVTPEQVARVFLAGAFANALDVRNAVAIGLLAPVPVERARRVGNASVRGAKALLLAGRRRRELEACSPGSSTSSPNPSRTSSICSSTVAASHRCRRPGVRSCFGALWGRSLGASSTTFGSGPAGCDASSACPSARAVPSGRSRESAT